MVVNTDNQWRMEQKIGTARMQIGIGIGALLILAVALFVGTDPFGINPIRTYPGFAAKYLDLPDLSQLPKFSEDPLNRLGRAELRFVDQIRGPESITFDNQGRGPYTGVSDGRILRWDGPSKGWVEFAVTSDNRTEECNPGVPPMPKLKYEHQCGRPLGIRFNKRTGDLVIADAYKGLMIVGPEGGQARVLTKEAEGEPFVFTNDLDIDDDDTIYFTDTSTKYQRRNFMLAVLEGDNTGRLLKYDPKTKKTTVLLKDLAFANGVALNKDKTFLVMAETATGRLWKYWIKGPKAGKSELFAIVPGHPDNVRMNPKGDFWVAVHCLRNKNMELLGPHPKLRNLVLRLPLPITFFRLFFVGQPGGFVLKYGADGRFIEALEDRSKRVALISEVEEKDGKLWLGSVLTSHIAVLTLDS